MTPSTQAVSYPYSPALPHAAESYSGLSPWYSLQPADRTALLVLRARSPKAVWVHRAIVGPARHRTFKRSAAGRARSTERRFISLMKGPTS